LWKLRYTPWVLLYVANWLCGRLQCLILSSRNAQQKGYQDYLSNSSNSRSTSSDSSLLLVSPNHYLDCLPQDLIKELEQLPLPWYFAIERKDDVCRLIADKRYERPMRAILRRTVTIKTYVSSATLVCVPLNLIDQVERVKIVKNHTRDWFQRYLVGARVHEIRFWWLFESPGGEGQDKASTSRSKLLIMIMRPLCDTLIRCFFLLGTRSARCCNHYSYTTVKWRKYT